MKISYTEEEKTNDNKVNFILNLLLNSKKLVLTSKEKNIVFHEWIFANKNDPSLTLFTLTACHIKAFSKDKIFKSFGLALHYSNFRSLYSEVNEFNTLHLEITRFLQNDEYSGYEHEITISEEVDF